MRYTGLVGVVLSSGAFAASVQPAAAEALGVPWLGSADAAVVQSILEYEVTGVARTLPESGASFTITRTDLSDGVCRVFVVDRGDTTADGVACRAASGGWTARDLPFDMLAAAEPGGAPPLASQDASPALQAGRTVYDPPAPGRRPIQVHVARDPETGEVRAVSSAGEAEAAELDASALPDEIADWEVVVTTVIPPPLPARHPGRQGAAPATIGLADLVEHAAPAIGGTVEPLLPAPPRQPDR